MLSFSMPELILILVVVLIVFGPGKLPEVGKALGKGLSEFRRAMNTEANNNEPVKIETKPSESKSDAK
jgi:sec-independent protein translocase protein TatA